MRTDVAEGLVVFRGVYDFATGTEIKPVLGVIPITIQGLHTVIDQLTAGGVSQERSDRARRAMTNAVKVQARRLRRVFLQPVAGVGKILFKNDPTLLRAVAMPSERGYERLIVAAYAMAAEAAERRSAFVAAGFEENFPDQLREAADLLRETIDARRGHVGQRSAASRGMRQELAKGRDLVRLLDTLVRPWLEEHAPERVAEWLTLTRFVRKRAAGEEAPVVPVVPVAPQTSSPSTGEAHAA